MKTEEEIKEEIAEMRECLKQESSYLASETFGYILALEWVLDEEKTDDKE